MPRRTKIVESLGDFDDEDLIEPEDMVVTATHSGYVKRTPLAEYRSQKRGGKGLMGMSTKDDDFITRLFSANTLTPVLFFTTDGIVYKLKTWRLPQGGRNAKGQSGRQFAADPGGRFYRRDDAGRRARGRVGQSPDRLLYL